MTGGAFGFAARGEDGGFGSNGGGGGGMTKEGWKEGLCNSVVFTWGFVEMLVWFWVKFFAFSLLSPSANVCRHCEVKNCFSVADAIGYRSFTHFEKRGKSSQPRLQNARKRRKRNCRSTVTTADLEL